MEKRKTKLSIKGMHCANCANTITKALVKTKGVGHAEVNFATENATVEFDPGEVSEKDIIGRIEKAGYAASVMDMKESRGAKKSDARRARKMLFFSLAFAMPALLISMFAMGLPYKGWILLALATPVQIISGDLFYRGAWGARE